MIRLAFVGCAHIHTRDFVERLRRRADVESFRWRVQVAAVWDHDRARAERVAAALGPATAVRTELREVLDDPAIGSVVIASENVRHTELVAACVRAGKDVFVDKPLAVTAADAHLLADLIDGSGVTFQTGYLRRAEPAVRFLRDEVRRGNLGTVTGARVRIAHGGALDGWFDDEWRWMADPAEAGFGGFGDVATHAVDLLCWVLGDRSPVARVTAAVGSLTDRRPGCDEFGEGLLVFDDGVIAAVAGSWVDPGAPVSVEVAGSHGHATFAHGELRYRSDHVDGADGRRVWTDLPPPLPHAFDLYLDALLGHPVDALVSAGEAADRVAVMEAMYAGAEQGRWVAPARRGERGRS
ncbi:Gfo/Idh/MocA family protein [Pseudonocardia lacus]|uniref:Gfo/Idh/MocA family protein n=1 Tax=Pseudonocardia lacus TaxID=2835865 RepID=UPI001BDCBA9F|nr:Gfo/Idh/MocA family oxidoreductase [Pseudonocardia lacus]